MSVEYWLRTALLIVLVYVINSQISLSSTYCDTTSKQQHKKYRTPYFEDTFSFSHLIFIMSLVRSDISAGTNILTSCSHESVHWQAQHVYCTAAGRKLLLILKLEFWPCFTSLHCRFTWMEYIPVSRNPIW